MDLIDVLERSLSCDVVEAENSQAVIDEIADFNLEEFLISLGKILSSTENSVQIRKAAAYQIKKILKTGDQWETRLEYQGRWLALAPHIRQLLKETVLDCLGTEKITPSPSADLIAFFASIDLPNDQWPELISTLTRNVTTSGNTDLIKEASLVAIGRLCHQNYESQKCKLELEKSSEIFKSIFHGLLYNNNNDVMTSAVNALREWICLKKDKSDPQIKSAIQRVFDLATYSDSRLKIASLRCLRKFQITCTDKKLANIMIDAIQSEISEIRIQGFKFWYEQCFEDTTRVRTKLEQALSQSFTLETLPKLLPVMLTSLTNHGHQDKEGNKLWILATDSVRVLSEWCNVTALRDYLTHFVQDHISNDDWKFRNSAVRACYALLWSDWDTVKPLIEKAIPVLLEMLDQDINRVVRYTAAVVIGGVWSKIQERDMLVTNLNAITEGFLKALKDEANVVCGICEALENISYTAYAVSEMKETYCLSPYFDCIVCSLLESLYRRNSSKHSRCSVYNALKCLLQYSAKDCKSSFNKLASAFAQRLLQVQLQGPQQSGDTNQPEVNYDTESISLLRALQTLIRIMGTEELSKSFTNIFVGLMHILKRPRCQLIIHAIALETVALIVKNLRELFLPYVDTVLPILITDLKNRRKEQVCIAAVQLLHAICNAIEHKFVPYCESTVLILLDNLRADNASRRIKESILLTIGDLAKVTGSSFKKYTDIILNTLTLTQSQLDKEYLLDNRIYALYIHHCHFLNAYSGIIQGLKNDPTTVNHIVLLLEPKLRSMIQVITRMALNKSEYVEMDDFYFAQAITLFRNICTIFGKRVQHLLRNEAILDILKTGCKSDKEETKLLSLSAINKLNQLNLISINTES